MRKKKLTSLTSKLNKKVIYFTENPFSFDGYEGYKYFLCWQNTHQIFQAFKTQQECIDVLQNLIKEKTIHVGTREFQVVNQN